MKNDRHRSLVLHDYGVGKGFTPSVEGARRMLLCGSVGMCRFVPEFQGSNECCFFWTCSAETSPCNYALVLLQSHNGGGEDTILRN